MINLLQTIRYLLILLKSMFELSSTLFWQNMNGNNYVKKRTSQLYSLCLFCLFFCRPALCNILQCSQCLYFYLKALQIHVLFNVWNFVTLDGNSEIGEHVWNEVGNLICLRRSFRSTAVTNFKSIFRETLFFLTGSQWTLSYPLI